MNKNVGIVRHGNSLKEALKLINHIDDDWKYVENEYYSDRLKSLKTVASLIINGAIAREESRGCHIRTDFQNEDSEAYYIYQSKDGIRKIKI